jgi:hypothetical protein
VAACRVGSQSDQPHAWVLGLDHEAERKRTCAVQAMYVHILNSIEPCLTKSMIRDCVASRELTYGSPCANVNVVINCNRYEAELLRCFRPFSSLDICSIYI